MRRIIPRTLVAILTFIVGLTGVWLLNHKAMPESKGVPELGPVALVVTPVQPPQFTPTLRACGMGYGQMYEMPDGQAMSEGAACSENSRIAKREWGRLLATATKIVERVPRYMNRSGEWGERVVALFPPDKYNGETTRILWYGGGQCYLYVRAPTLEIALEFEKTNAYAY